MFWTRTFTPNLTIIRRGMGGRWGMGQASRQGCGSGTVPRASRVFRPAAAERERGMGAVCGGPGSGTLGLGGAGTGGVRFDRPNPADGDVDGALSKAPPKRKLTLSILSDIGFPSFVTLSRA